MAWTRTSLVVVIDIDDDGATNGRVPFECILRALFVSCIGTHTQRGGG